MFKKTTAIALTAAILATPAVASACDEDEAAVAAEMRAIQDYAIGAFTWASPLILHHGDPLALHDVGPLVEPAIPTN